MLGVSFFPLFSFTSLIVSFGTLRLFCPAYQKAGYTCTFPPAWSLPSSPPPLSKNAQAWFFFHLSCNGKHVFVSINSIRLYGKRGKPNASAWMVNPCFYLIIGIRWKENEDQKIIIGIIVSSLPVRGRRRTLYRVALKKKRNSRYSRFFRTLLWLTVILFHLAG